MVIFTPLFLNFCINCVLNMRQSHLGMCESVWKPNSEQGRNERAVSENALQCVKSCYTPPSSPSFSLCPLFLLSLPPLSLTLSLSVSCVPPF